MIAFAISLGLVIIFGFLYYPQYINDNFTDYFYATLSTMTALLNTFALLIMIHEKLQKVKKKNRASQKKPKTYNLLLHNLCLLFEIIVWILIATEVVVEKNLQIIILFVFVYAGSRFSSNYILKRDSIALGVAISCVIMFYTLLHLFFIENIFATIILVLLFVIFNYLSLKTYTKYILSSVKNNPSTNHTR